ncbi:MAG: ATP-binding protein [Chromatiales bacterium]|nr:ATP-binding protein [Chromatiales bacterium]
MRLVEVVLENFRGYAAPTRVKIDDLTAFVGRNDAGKSSVLEALQIVLGDGKLDGSDAHVHAPIGGHVVIECAFDELPNVLTLDAGSTTALADELLLDERGFLRLRWKWPIIESGIGRESVCAVALHPIDSVLGALLDKKNSDLKQLVEAAEIEGRCDRHNNASMRFALRQHARETGALTLGETELPLAREEGKTILKQVRDKLPLYVLFRADRPSTDQDAEVQDPMKVAVRAALEELAPEIGELKRRVREKSIEVANRTLGKLRDFDAQLAKSLTPEFADPKLDTAFKLTLVGDNGIAVNKRGSGVRRLVLFSFFRAEAERLQAESVGRGIIYAVEEPETAQHPTFQRRVVAALEELAAQSGRQVLLTTHSPGVAGILPVETLRFVSAGDSGREISFGDEIVPKIAETLGVIPDHRVRVFVCVEGPNDRAFLQAACAAYRAADEDFVCLETDPAVAFILLGGSTLTEWVKHNLLEHTRIPEFHLYDSDVHKYGQSVAAVRARGSPHSARQTCKREMENYLAPAVVTEVLAAAGKIVGCIAFGDDDDVEAVVAAAIPDHQGNPARRVARRPLKHWLNYDVARAMTAEDWDARDPVGEIRGWLTEITQLARSP